MYLHTKSSYFHIANASRIRYHLPVAAYQPCSTLGASQHWSIPHCKILFVFVNEVLQDQPSESTPKSPSPPRRKSVQSAPALVGTPKFMMDGWLSRRYYYYYYSNSTVTVPELRNLN